MVSLLIITFVLFSISSSSSIIQADDNVDNLSVNTGETTKFICDLPEKYSNKQVSLHPHLDSLWFWEISLELNVEEEEEEGEKKISIINLIT